MQHKQAYTLLPVIALYSQLSIADHPIEETLVTDKYHNYSLNLEPKAATADAAAILKHIPGGQVNGNGELTQIPQYRGMYGARINTLINTQSINSAGPNAMDPALSYANPFLLESFTVHSSTAPVSKGVEAIGGTIEVKEWRGEFNNNNQFNNETRISLGTKTSNKSTQFNLANIVANQNHKLFIAGSYQHTDNLEFPDGEIKPTEYLRKRYQANYSFQQNNHFASIEVSHTDTGDAGTPSLPMDIQYIKGNNTSVNYNYNGDNIVLENTLFTSHLKHGMTNYHLRPQMNLAGWRKNITYSETLGFNSTIKFLRDNSPISAGLHWQTAEHGSDIDNPNNAMFFVKNFNEIERSITSIFVEQEISQGNIDYQWGVRYSHVASDAQNVNGTPAMMNPQAKLLRDKFNQAEKKQKDNLLDWSLNIKLNADQQKNYFLDLARKSRAPSYQERYLWLPLEATGGLADMRTYTGNIELEPEVAHEIAVGINYQNNNLLLKPRLFYRDVDNYIQGIKSNNVPAIKFVNMMNMMSGMNRPAPLMFENTDAKFYGFDMAWQVSLNEKFYLDGLINAVHAKQTQINEAIYRIAPNNLTVAANYKTGNQLLRFEIQSFAKQNKVSKINQEQASRAYNLVNVSSLWKFNDKLSLHYGVNNLLNKNYQNHLTGYNRVMGNNDIAVGERIYGEERNLFANINWRF